MQEQGDDVFTGRTTLRLGPPRHLSPQDFVAALQAARGLRPVPRVLADARVDGGSASPYSVREESGPAMPLQETRKPRAGGEAGGAD